MAVTSSFTWLTGCTVPRGASDAGSETSTRSDDSRVSSDAFSSSLFFAAMASATRSRSALN